MSHSDYFGEYDWHESFYRSDNMKSVLEFELPKDEREYYDAVNGHKYRSAFIKLYKQLEENQRELVGKPLGEFSRDAIKIIDQLATEYDIKINRK